MTTEENAGTVEPNEDLDRLSKNLERIEELTKRLTSALALKKEMTRPSLQGPGQDLYMKAAAAYLAEMMSNPGRMIENQVSYWGKSLKHAVEAQQKLAHGELEAPEDHTPADRRFSNPLWQSHPYFNFLKQQYMISSDAMRDAVSGIEGLDDVDRQRVDYFARQMVDMMAPTNFFSMNPDALERAVETQGQSLIDGLENMIRDLEINNGEFLVTLADPEAFEVGGNVGTAQGSVVFRNRMFELIQYAPTTEEVHATPLILFPPWINKFYILDLQPKNSLIRWIVDQGYTLYVVSWVNPDATYADVGLEDYIEEGYLTAISEVKKVTKQRKVNVIGYCIAGTTLALTLSLMKTRGDHSVKSATFFTTLTDFSDQGEFTSFLTDDFIDGIEAEVKEKGILPSYIMSRTFSFLRSNDLIYRPAIDSYMLGKAPPAFDLLYWNGDGTNLPARMAMDYLRGLCQRDEFAGDCAGIGLMGETLRIEDVDVPLCAIACETDHIAAWKSSYRGFAKMGSKDKTFLLSESGHVAGIVNPPSKKKYGHYTNASWPETPESWQEGAEFHDGSWWPRWEAWLKPRSGKLVPARQPGDSSLDVLGPAPGTYVKAKAKV